MRTLSLATLLVLFDRSRLCAGTGFPLLRSSSSSSSSSSLIPDTTLTHTLTLVHDIILHTDTVHIMYSVTRRSSVQLENGSQFCHLSAACGTPITQVKCQYLNVRHSPLKASAYTPASGTPDHVVPSDTVCMKTKLFVGTFKTRAFSFAYLLASILQYPHPLYALPLYSVRRYADFPLNCSIGSEVSKPGLQLKGYLASQSNEGDNAGEMSPESSTESYPAFARIGLRENPGKNLNQVTCPYRDSNPGHLVSRPDALTVTPQPILGSHSVAVCAHLVGCILTTCPPQRHFILLARQRIPNLTGPVDNNDVIAAANKKKTSVGLHVSKQFTLLPLPVSPYVSRTMTHFELNTQYSEVIDRSVANSEQKKMDVTMKELKEKVEDFSRKMEEMQLENIQMKRKLKFWKDKQRKKNLVSFGVEEMEQEKNETTYDTVFKVCWEVSNMDVSDGQIEEAYRFRREG
ncbi:hypothetical protein ANN_24851 [Periplaneta americana]|uniref:Uncharacterized protein n=1 Tax=Periplaneta americana TaxID=6978 RepID=A0ABQ8S015_PERAM|nr:hypothetical protein ANN_24851 [Periplaneta americana]